MTRNFVHIKYFCNYSLISEVHIFTILFYLPSPPSSISRKICILATKINALVLYFYYYYISSTLY